jgi:peroxiredoxin
VKILAISADPKDVSAKLKSELHIGFPLLSDEDEQVVKQYGLLHPGGNNGSDISRPANLLLDTQGVIRWAAFTDNIHVRPHPEAVLGAAKQLH